jgi:dephospho-CoA kinase
MARDRLSRERAQDRVGSQYKYKKEAAETADYILKNDGNLVEFIEKAKRLAEELIG